MVPVYDLLDFNVQIGNYRIEILRFRHTINKVYTENHFHSAIELHLSTGGSSQYIVNYDKSYNINENDFLIIGNGTAHEEIIKDVESVGDYCLRFNIKNIKTNKDDKELNRLIESLISVDFLLIHNAKEIRQIFDDIFYELSLSTIGSLECANHMLSRLIILMARLTLKENEKIKLGEKYDDIQQIRNITDIYFNRILKEDKIEEISLHQLASELYTSERNLNRLLYKLYGSNFSQIVMESKVRLACYLLISTNCTMEEISQRCAWSQVAFFKNFKSMTKKTPSEYRKLHVQDGQRFK